MVYITEKWDFHNMDIIDYDVDYNTLNLWIIVFCFIFGGGLLIIKSISLKWHILYVTWHLQFPCTWCHFDLLRAIGNITSVIQMIKPTIYNAFSPGVSTWTKFPITCECHLPPHPTKYLYLIHYSFKRWNYDEWIYFLLQLFFSNFLF